MKAGAVVAQMAWAAASLPAWRRFRAALRDPEREQLAVLRRCLAANADTAFGRAHGFKSIRTVDEFRSRVPIRTPDEFTGWIARIAAGDRHVLTRQPVERLVPSGGSTAAVKLVPYTPALRAELSHAVGAWIADLYLSRPALMGGRAYWSVTPAVSQERPFVESGADAYPAGAASIPVGFDDDAAYLGGVRGALARRALAVPADVRWESGLEAFQDRTLLHLLLAEDLRLVSVWHPSVFAGLLDALGSRWDVLIDRVAGCDARRARVLRTTAPDDVCRIWPRLALLSCWLDGPARASADGLAARLPGVEVQGKGLLATEGIVSVPFSSRYPLAIRSHFLEFIDAAGEARLAHELAVGQEYAVVMTTGGGLYRYRLGDRVRVDGVVSATPSVRFVGRDDRVSDLFGEKLSDGFVAAVLERLFVHRPVPTFAMVAPDKSRRDGNVSYVLYIDSSSPPADLARQLEAELRRNPHYAWCVDLGQLRPARVTLVGPGATEAFLARGCAAGQRLGEIKPASLDGRMGWGEVLPRLSADRRI